MYVSIGVAEHVKAISQMENNNNINNSTPEKMEKESGALYLFMLKKEKRTTLGFTVRIYT